MEKELYNHKFMSIKRLKNILENYSLNILIDYLEINSNLHSGKIFFEDINVLTLKDNHKLTFYLKQKFSRNYKPVQCIEI